MNVFSVQEHILGVGYPIARAYSFWNGVVRTIGLGGGGHEAAVCDDHEKVARQAKAKDDEPRAADVDGDEDEENEVGGDKQDAAGEIFVAEGAEDGEKLEEDSKKRRYSKVDVHLWEVEAPMSAIFAGIRADALLLQSLAIWR